MSPRFEIGRLSDILARPAALAAVLVVCALAVTFAAVRHAQDTSDGCLYCHADRARMAKDGYPQFFMTNAQVEKESRMPGIKCRDCHLGDGTTHDKDIAHRGMLKLLVLDNNALVVPRKGRLDSLTPTGDDRMYALLPKISAGGKLLPDPDTFTILWHDRDPVSLGYDRAIAQKTCGRPGCHPKETEQFEKSIMGGNVRQRSTRHWTDTHGPNNCGPSFADLPPNSGGQTGYSENNYKIIRDDLSCPSTYGNATDRQRFCNLCHAGCLDCHYYPNTKSGVHSFTRRVPAANCSGGGRGTGMCHAGTMERRRGDSYLGAEYSQPAGSTPDAHVAQKMECVDCHETGEKGMGDLQRRVDCAGCHYFINRAHEAGVHRKLRCEACHVGSLGGYEMTVWGKGHIAGQETPFKKYSLYYGVLEAPILMKDTDGLYAPYKVWPNIATNIKGEKPNHGRVEFRWPGGETRDAYALLGTYSTMPGANKALAWLQLEAVGHPLGKSRSCASCHGSTVQKTKATWEFLNYAGSEPFTGSQDIVADSAGLRIVNITKTSEPSLMGDAELYDFAAWMYLGDIWHVPGDFSIPRADEAKYKNYVMDEAAFKAGISKLDGRLNGLPKGGKDYAALERRIKKLKGIGEHDPAAGLAEMRKG